MQEDNGAILSCIDSIYLMMTDNNKFLYYEGQVHNSYYARTLIPHYFVVNFSYAVYEAVYITNVTQASSFNTYTYRLLAIFRHIKV